MDKLARFDKKEGKTLEISFSKSSFQSECCAKHHWLINVWDLAARLFARMGKISSLKTFWF